MCDELIKRLRETSVDFGELDHVSVMMIEAADAIEDLITALTASNEVIAKRKPRWIPVTERLPEINQKVLVFSFYTMHVYKFCALDEKCGAAEDHWQDDYGIAHGIEEVQFWMPLPEPPEESGKA